ncbi:MAG TPA: hypothetical protein VGL81_08035 [Polyangiaceae bacterium]|jgi:hypothetical protein
MTIKGKNAKAAQVTNIITGTRKRLPNGNQVITIGGGTFTVDQAVAKMQIFVTNRDDVETAQAAATVAVAAERAQAPSLLAFIAAFVTFVRLTFDNAADALADFDLAPPKVPAPMTAEAKAVAAAKRLATRAARGTTSAKAKKNVKGNITAKLVVTPATPASPDAPAAAPAPAAGGTAPSGGTPPTPAAHS